MRKLLITTSIVSSTVVLAVAGAPTSTAAPASAPSAAVAVPAQAPASELAKSRSLSASSTQAAAAATCTFYTRGDNVHVTSGDASGHGWWDRGDCPAGIKAKVTIWVQEYYSDGSWRNKGSGSKTVYAGGGSANRANARSTCQNTTSTSWRSKVDVDLVGIADSPNVYYTPSRLLNCRVN